jgi:hypothetical protein
VKVRKGPRRVAKTPDEGATPAPRVIGSTASLPGLENPVIDEVSNAAMTLFSVQSEKAALKKREDLAAQKLFTVMASHDLKRYRDSEHNLIAERVTSKEKVKVRFAVAKRGKKK